MSDPPLSDIDFKNKMAWVWTTLEFSVGDLTIVLETDHDSASNCGLNLSTAVGKGFLGALSLIRWSASNFFAAALEHCVYARTSRVQ